MALDFDGTIAPIVDRPEDARPDPKVVSALSELIHNAALVAVISGRDSAFLSSQLPAMRLRLVGNHGLEQQRNGTSEVAPEVAPYLPALRLAADELGSLLPTLGTGVELEVKRVSLSLHYRRQPGRGDELGERLQRLAAQLGLRLSSGRLVWELLPPVAMDKGSALTRLAAEIEPRGLVFVGDDYSDRGGFAAAHALNQQHSLAVGVTSSETPAEVFADCDLLVSGPAGVAELLQALLKQPD